MFFLCSVGGARVVVIVFAFPLTASNHQTQTQAMRELLRYLELWRGTRPFILLTCPVSVQPILVFDFVACVFLHSLDQEML
jgi:hypothetical protein